MKNLITFIKSKIPVSPYSFPKTYPKLSLLPLLLLLLLLATGSRRISAGKLIRLSSCCSSCRRCWWLLLLHRMNRVTFAQLMQIHSGSRFHTSPKGPSIASYSSFFFFAIERQKMNHFNVTPFLPAQSARLSRRNFPHRAPLVRISCRRKKNVNKRKASTS